jgi:hypothetical protein
MAALELALPWSQAAKPVRITRRYLIPMTMFQLMDFD